MSEAQGKFPPRGFLTVRMFRDIDETRSEYWDKKYPVMSVEEAEAMVRERYSEEEIFAAFAKSIGVTDARGWTTGQNIIRALKEARAQKEQA